MPPGGRLRRLLAPRHVAVYGGTAAAEAIRQCRLSGYAGEIWPVHPERHTIEGLPCYPDTASLPAPPDAAFLAVSRHLTVGTVGELAAQGAGGAVCFAAGFKENHADGVTLQQDLVEAAGPMPLLGPNCYGYLNLLDGVALWPDQHGAHRVDRGVAVITQSGNIGQNLTMQRRSLPLAMLITAGNAAVTGIPELIEALLDDPRVTAIGLHLEGIDGPAALARAALLAARRGVPVVALKTGTSALGAATNFSHTSSLAGSAVLGEALFRRVGIAPVNGLEELVETLKFLHVHGTLAGRRVTSASCSGGEAALVADLAQANNVEMPPFPAATQRRLSAVLGDRVTVANPLDYHTYIWGDRAAQNACFSALLSAGFDMHLLLLDFPRNPLGRAAWDQTVDAFVDAARNSAAPASVVSSLPEGMPERVGRRLLEAGIAPMQGLGSCLAAVAAAQEIGVAHRRVDHLSPPVVTVDSPVPPLWHLDEWSAKQALAAIGVPVPVGLPVPGDEVVMAAGEIGYPVVVKSLTVGPHKSDAGGVRLALTDEQQVKQAAAELSTLGDRFLVERMVSGAVAELLIGVHQDPRFGLALTIGAGGVLVELSDDTVTLLLPASADDIRAALHRLRCWPLLAGYRGRPAGDVDTVVDAITAISRWAAENAARVAEVEVNPLLVLPDGDGVVAADALIVTGEPVHG